MTRRYTNATYRKLRILRTAGLYMGLAVVMIYTLFPYYWAMVSSTRTGEALYATDILPRWDFTNYVLILTNPIFVGSLVNSAFVATAATLLSLLVAALASYALSRLHFPASRVILVSILLISIFPQVVVLSGMFEVVQWLGLYNRPAGLVVAYLILTLPFTTWILTSFMRQQPKELEEAALIDGCSYWRVLTKILLPLMWPAMVSTGLLAFILAWNEFLFALTFILTDDNRTVPVAIGLLTGSTRFEFPYGQIMAASVTVTLPLLVLIFIFQRRIVAGLTSGAVKG